MHDTVILINIPWIILNVVKLCSGFPDPLDHTISTDCLKALIRHTEVCGDLFLSQLFFLIFNLIRTHFVCRRKLPQGYLLLQKMHKTSLWICLLVFRVKTAVLWCCEFLHLWSHVGTPQKDNTSRPNAYITSLLNWDYVKPFCNIQPSSVCFKTKAWKYQPFFIYMKVIVGVR